jgi:hypothetical protein
VANIKVVLDYPLFDGMAITFNAPCDCTAVNGLTVSNGGNSKSFTFRDSHGADLTGLGNLFSAGAYVKVILDIVNGFAYIQNADTNSYIESTKATLPKCAAGSVISIKDSIVAPLHGLTLYGKTPQVTTTGKNLYSNGDLLSISVYRNITLAKPLPPGEYTLSAVVVSNDTDSSSSLVSFIGGASNGNNVNVLLKRNNRASVKVTLTAEVSTIRFCAGNSTSNSSGDTAEYTDIQIEAGSTATEYEPYSGGVASPSPDWPQELVSAGNGGSISVTVTDGTDSNVQTITAQMPNGLPGIPVASGGNYTDENGQQWACDEIDFARGVYVQRVYSKVLDGTERWYKSSTQTSDVTSAGATTYNGAAMQKNFALSKECLSAHFPYNGANKPGTWVKVNAKEFEVRIAWAFATVDELKAFLAEQYNAGNPVTIQYALLNPIETPLSAEELAQYAALHTNKPNTTVMNDAGAYMDVEYFATNAAVPIEAGAANEGKFLRVVNGAAAWVTVNSAEGGSF